MPLERKKNREKKIDELIESLRIFRNVKRRKENG